MNTVTLMKMWNKQAALIILCVFVAYSNSNRIELENQLIVSSVQTARFLCFMVIYILYTLLVCLYPINGWTNQTQIFKMCQFEKYAPKFENDFKWPTFREQLKATIIYRKGCGKLSLILKSYLKSQTVVFLFHNFT